MLCLRVLRALPRRVRPSLVISTNFPSLFLWRSLSQWIGGLGVIVFFVAILTSLGAGAKILFSNESSVTAADFEQGRIQDG